MRQLAFLLLSLVLVSPVASAQDSLPAEFVYLRDVDPGIAQDIRYATSNNFVGRPLPGYGGAECVLRRDVAAALKRVQADLASLQLGLKVYDCYRPTRAVRAMRDWADDATDRNATKRFFPSYPKTALFSLGYIAARSRHSTGTAVDLTLIEKGAAPAAVFDPQARYGPCNGPSAQRAPDNSVDMGTGYDCLDRMSHTRNSAIGPEALLRRKMLADAMNKQGFRNYFREWWHFDYAGGEPAHPYDFPISKGSAR